MLAMRAKIWSVSSCTWAWLGFLMRSTVIGSPMVMVMRPPGGLTLNSRTLQRINRQALAAGESLMLPAPSRESIDDALTDVAYVDDGAIWSEDAVAEHFSNRSS